MIRSHFARTFLATVAALVLSTVLAASESSGARATIAKSHASLSAYPNAVISLKDPKTRCIFYVESNGRRLVAFNKNGEVLWSVDVLEAIKGTPIVGQPVIRDLKLDKDRITVTIAKHAYAEVQTRDGKIQYLGAD